MNSWVLRIPFLDECVMYTSTLSASDSKGTISYYTWLGVVITHVPLDARPAAVGLILRSDSL